MFGGKRDDFNGARERRDRWARSRVTAEFWASQPAGRVSSKTPARATSASSQAVGGGIIDRFVFAALDKEGIAPAPPTTDYEFVRRVSFDLTGRPPRPERVQAFVLDSSPEKRAKLVDELLATPEWVDKWSMWASDHLRVVSTTPSTGTQFMIEGRDAFHNWIRKSLSENKSWKQMALELIAARGANSWEQGELNWIVNGRMNMGVPQDNFDRSAALMSEQFLGMAHMDCLLCHSGRGHLDTLSIWGTGASRMQAWQMAAFFSRTGWRLARPDTTNNNYYYWTVTDQGTANYPLNRASGNRPDRNPIGTITAVAPEYIFTGARPVAGKTYRESLAEQVVADPLFAKAAVNYLWGQFFGRAIVEPANQLDPARLDPNNVPTDCEVDRPCGLQSPHVPLLNALAAEFAKRDFDLKWLMREIVLSDAYQLSSRYEGEWNPNWEPLFARKLVRRLWGEEVMDAITQVSGIPNNINVRVSQVNTNVRTINWAMQLPEPFRTGGAFVNAFLPGNRDDEERRPDAAIQQAMSMMNDPFVMARIRATGTGASASLLRRALELNDEAAVDLLFLTVLSRPASDQEKRQAVAHLRGGNRTQRGENLLWSLYNKVDFLFNY
jgi:hypothetical protein